MTDKEDFHLNCIICDTEIRVGDWASIQEDPVNPGQIGAVFCKTCAIARGMDKNEPLH